MLDGTNQCSQNVTSHQCQDKKVDQSTESKGNELNCDMEFYGTNTVDMDDYHHDEAGLEDAEVKKDTADSTVQQEEPERIKYDGANSSCNIHPVPLQQQHQQQK